MPTNTPCSSCGCGPFDFHAQGCPVAEEQRHAEMMRAQENRRAMGRRLADRAIAEAVYSRTGVWNPVD